MAVSQGFCCICITDIATAKSDDSRAADVVRNWLRNRRTLEFLPTWEEIYNPNCNYRDDLQWLPHAEEADLLNVALFGFTAKAWRESNPELAKVVTLEIMLRLMNLRYFRILKRIMHR